MKIFFTSRAAMRTLKSGKAHDHGILSVKRWSRELEKPGNVVDKRKAVIKNKGKFVDVVTLKNKLK